MSCNGNMRKNQEKTTQLLVNWVKITSTNALLISDQWVKQEPQKAGKR